MCVFIMRYYCSTKVCVLFTAGPITNVRELSRTVVTSHLAQAAAACMSKRIDFLIKCFNHVRTHGGARGRAELGSALAFHA